MSHPYSFVKPGIIFSSISINPKGNCQDQASSALRLVAVERLSELLPSEIHPLDKISEEINVRANKIPAVWTRMTNLLPLISVFFWFFSLLFFMYCADESGNSSWSLWAVIIFIKFCVPQLNALRNIIFFFYRLFVILSRETSNLKTYFNKPSESYFLYKCTAFLSQICLFMKYVKIHIKYLSKPGHPISSKNILRCAVSIRPSNFIFREKYCANLYHILFELFGNKSYRKKNYCPQYEILILHYSSSIKAIWIILLGKAWCRLTQNWLIHLNITYQQGTYL